LSPFWLANDLSQLGISANQLDRGLGTAQSHPKGRYFFALAVAVVCFP